MSRHIVRALGALALALLVATGPGSVVRGAEEPSHTERIEAWRAGRIERLTRETGWLTLTGLHRLAEGSTTLGTAPESDIVVEGNVPSDIGLLEIAGDSIRFHPSPASRVTIDGAAVTETLALRTDREGPATLLEIGPVNFHVIERGELLLLRIRDREHPDRASFPGIGSFEIDPSWRFDARFEVYEPTKQIPIANIIGIVSDTPSWGAVVFEHGGETYRIDAVAEPGDEELFLIFGDETSGRETYGGGRYLYADAPDAEGRVDLDFNRAYNPPCAFTPFATCPLPPSQNRLPLRIEAGEKSFAGEH